jgi:hypothetical protein
LLLINSFVARTPESYYRRGMDSYFLPNGAKIDTERMIEAILEEDAYPQLYLDTELGGFYEVPTEDILRRWQAEIGTTNRYMLVERFTLEEREEVALDFMDTMLEDMDQLQVATARHTLAMGGWEAMEEYFEKKTDGWIHGWDQFVHDEAGDFADEQLMQNPYAEVIAKFEGCGDCPLCSLMAEEESTEFDALTEAFQEVVFEKTIMESVQLQMEDFMAKKNAQEAHTTKAIKTIAPSTRKTKKRKQ